jgi:hypothetical protein
MTIRGLHGTWLAISSSRLVSQLWSISTKDLLQARQLIYSIDNSSMKRLFPVAPTSTSRISIPSSDSPRSRGIALVFAAVLSVLSLSGCYDGPEDSYSKRTEEVRVTSPNGEFDAGLGTYIYGPAAGGGVDSNVYIVRKGAPTFYKAGREVFSADPMTCGKLVWKRDHLLEIHYDIANIHSFRNTWGRYEIEDVGSTGSRNFEVEIQLVPSSDSSALKLDGSFRSMGYQSDLENCIAAPNKPK